MEELTQHEKKKREIMGKCFACYCETGLRETGIKSLAAACGMTAPNLYGYFTSVDELIVQSTEYCHGADHHRQHCFGQHRMG